MSQDNIRQDIYQVNWLWFRKYFKIFHVIVIAWKPTTPCTKCDSNLKRWDVCLSVAFRQSSKMFAPCVLSGVEAGPSWVQHVCPLCVCQELPVCHRNWLTLLTLDSLKMCQIYFINTCPSLKHVKRRRSCMLHTKPNCCRFFKFPQKCSCIAPWAGRVRWGG